MKTDSIEQNWQQLSRTALLGTSRSGAVKMSAQPGLSFPEADPEVELLKNAAVLTQVRRVGQIRSYPCPALGNTSPQETRQAVNSAAENTFAGMLQGHYPELIGEWLEVTAKANKRLPFRLIPGALDLGRTRKELADGIARTIGARGFWLVTQNEDWKFILRQDLTDVPDSPHHTMPSESDLKQVWETGERDERTHILRLLRREKSLYALQLIRDTWSDSPAQERIAQLELLQPELSQADEAFLEAALDDRSKDVRNRAARLLATLAGSAYSQRMTVRLQSMVRMTKPILGSLKVEIEPPAVCDKEMQRDGIDPKPPPATGLGERAWWFQQVVSLTAPTIWIKSPSGPLSPQVLLAATATSDWRKPLINGLAESSVLFNDSEWLVPLLLEKEMSLNRRDMLRALDPEQRSTVFEGLISDNLQASAEAAVLLSQTDRFAWSAKLSRNLFECMQKLVVDPQSTGRYYLWTALFQKAGLCIPITMCGDAKSLWSEESPALRQWHSAIDTMLNILQFRKEMIREIQQP